MMEYKSVWRVGRIVLAFILSVVGLYSFRAPVQAQDANEVGKHKISLEIENESIQTALKTLFFIAGKVKYRVASNVDFGNASITCSASELPLDTVLGMILRSAKGAGGPLKYSVENGMYVISLSEPTVDPSARHRVTVSGEKADIREILKRAFEQAGVKYEIDKTVSGTVTVSLKDEHLLTAGLQKIIYAAKTDALITFRSDKDGIYQVLLQSDPRVQSDISKSPVSFKCENMDIRYAIKNLFVANRLNYTLDQRVHGSATLTIKETPFRDALDQILKTSSIPLTWRMEDHVYVIEPKEPQKR